MPGKLKLELVEGENRGKTFEFDEHDTFLFGRSSDSHICLPDDRYVSRNHFILEANPPDARIRDLGSRNGTRVNDTEHGGRKKGETPKEAAKRKYPEVDLHDGDRITVGKTVLVMKVETPADCCVCGREIADGEREACTWRGGKFICPNCRQELVSSNKPEPTPKEPEPMRCQRCGKDVSAEIGSRRSGDYVCEECQASVQEDPLGLLQKLLQEAQKARGPQARPEIAGYDFVKKLGEGGFGAVYLARRSEDFAPVALKVMLSKVAVDERSRDKFLREIDALRSLDHRNIVRLFTQGSVSSAFYFVMEYCEGGSVWDLMRQNGWKLPLHTARPIVLQALDGLAYCHSNDYVHRDLKPQNILLTGGTLPGEAGSEADPLEGMVTGESMTAKITDFGLAKNFEKAGFSGMTATGGHSGSFAFMPREQVTNFKYVKPVSDVWSMAATFYAMLTGKPPRDFPTGKDPVEVILQGRIIPIAERDPSVPTAVADVIDRALADKAKERYQTAEELRKELNKVL